MLRGERLRWLGGGQMKSHCCTPLTIWLDHGWAGRSTTKGPFMMNHTYGWMDGWMGGGTWLWTVIAVLVVVLLVVLISRVSSKKS